MKIQSLITLVLLMCGITANAQDLSVNVVSPSFDVHKDSAVLKMDLVITATSINPRGYALITPQVKSGNNAENLTQVRINGKKAHKMYMRSLTFGKKSRNNDDPAWIYSLSDGESQTINYRSSVATADWMHKADVVIKKEIFDNHGKIISSETTPVVQNANTEMAMAESSFYGIDKADFPIGDSVALMNSETARNYKGSYVSPESDSTDERNQREFDFSLDEARVIAEINPQILSLRELYTVAVSYKNIPERFYRIIDISVRIYPASSIANLNAAAAAIERGDTQAAGRYLRMAAQENLAYKNCRGAYELMCNNISEGIRLLKSAKAEGSEEAAYNLKIFFESNQPNALPN